jgi:hypothetical protein
LPLRIRWSAESTQGDALNLRDGTGVKIKVSSRANDIVGVLKFARDNGFSSVACTVTNGNYPGLTQTEFQEIFGKYV